MCVALAADRWRRVCRCSPIEIPRGIGPSRWLAGLEARQSSSPLALAVRRLTEVTSREHGVAEINELLLEVEGQLAARAWVATAGARLTLLFAAWGAVVEGLEYTLDAFLWAVLTCGVGVVCAGLTWRFGQKADAEAVRLRQAWNRVARQLAGWLDEGGTQALDHDRNQR